jgi:hypothetical protein
MTAFAKKLGAGHLASVPVAVPGPAGAQRAAVEIDKDDIGGSVVTAVSKFGSGWR